MKLTWASSVNSRGEVKSPAISVSSSEAFNAQISSYAGLEYGRLSWYLPIKQEPKLSTPTKIGVKPSSFC
jgi:hypothetical protein